MTGTLAKNAAIFAGTILKINFNMLVIAKIKAGNQLPALVLLSF